MFKRLRIAGLILLVLIALTAYLSWTPDIPHATLAEKYATGASDFVDLPSGARAHYRMQGNPEGRTVLLLHGSNASLHTWEGWVDSLEVDYFLVTVDLPGHGLTGSTPADDYTYGGMVTFLKEFADALNVDNFILGGNSMGGGVTLAYTLAHPGDVAGLILVDAAGIDTPADTRIQTDRPLAFDLAGNSYLSWILENITPRSVVREGLEKSISDHSMITETMIDRYWELARHPGNRRATGKRFAWYSEGRQELPVGQIAQPTLILWGEEDSLIPVETAKLLSQRIKGAEMIVYPNVGHIPMEEIPAITAAAVRAFITRLEETPQQPN